MTPSRNVIVSARRSALHDQPVASCGTKASFSSRSMSLSHTAASATRSVTLVLCAGSRVAGSPTMPMRSGSAAPGVIQARSRRSAPIVPARVMGMVLVRFRADYGRPTAHPSTIILALVPAARYGTAAYRDDLMAQYDVDLFVIGGGS